MKEADLRDNLIVPLARTLGWLTYWTWNSKHSPSGFPDMALLHPAWERMVFAELKMVGKHPTPAQQEWLDGIGALQGITGGLVRRFVWTPADWFNGTIEAELRKRNHHE